jgi:hypothetical protein
MPPFEMSQLIFANHLPENQSTLDKERKGYETVHNRQVIFEPRAFGFDFVALSTRRRASSTELEGKRRSPKLQPFLRGSLLHVQREDIVRVSLPCRLRLPFTSAQ